MCYDYYCTQQTFDLTVKRTKSTVVNIKYKWGNNDGCAEEYICASALYLIKYSAEAHIYCDF